MYIESYFILNTFIGNTTSKFVGRGLSECEENKNYIGTRRANKEFLTGTQSGKTFFRDFPVGYTSILTPVPDVEIQSSKEPT